MGKVSKWNTARRKLKVQFERAGQTRCQLCGSGMFLGFAHRLKRRYITTDDELSIAALLCVQCHEKLEYGPKDEMYEVVTRLHHAALGG
jgi:hypothetical protein